jgi:hypothetical protein
VVQRADCEREEYVDLSLIVEGQQPLGRVTVDPAFPQEIQPEKTS